ncbi:MAG: glycosyltransferase [Spirochaetales bacterium]|nr:glycosyltransferase [Spirochaetales bacterium]
MNFFHPAWFIFLTVLLLNLITGILFFFSGLYRKIRARHQHLARAIIGTHLGQESGMVKPAPVTDRFIRRHRWLFLEECSKISDSINLTGNQQEILKNLLSRNRVDVRLFRDLHSKNRYRRLRSALYLPLVPTQNVCTLLIHALEREQCRLVKLYLIDGLSKVGGAGVTIPSIIDGLAGEPLRFQKRIWGLLSELGDEMAALVPLFKQRTEKEIRLLLIHFARCSPTTELQEYLENLVDSEDLDIAHEAIRVLTTVYVGSMNHERYLVHNDFLIRNLVAESLGRLPADNSLELLFKYMNDHIIRKSVTLALTAIVRAQPKYFNRIMYQCLKEERPMAHTVFVDVLSKFVDYLMEKLLSPDAEMIECILFEIIQQGKMKEIINFLNQNVNAEIKEKVFKVLRWLIFQKPEQDKEQEKRLNCIRELQYYLKENLLDELGLHSKSKSKERLKKMEHSRRPLLVLFLFTGLGIVPVVCLLFSFFTPHTGFSGLVQQFFSCFNSVFALYASSLNMIYILLLIFSIKEIRRQSGIDSLIRHSFLFKEYILPSISIISPAFNEEASIVESVSALLNLRYPDYEIIVINDGSQDNTLEKLVSHFELERTEIFIHRYLNTQEIRGVYASKQYPELLVVDKMNGGKADSLNAGINIARKEYFAGIDADSLLERDALLNMAGIFLYSENEVIAAGGNILPVNGCTVRKGALVKKRIPKGHIARFQTIEYLRAFMAGRVGWSALKLLLIISGAFGVFHRRTVVNAHGYLTQSEYYMANTAGKDTVGEDMELVVRLIRGLRERRIPFSVQYGYNANCWTEIPETTKVLVQQRDRWQRGLLEIITFHMRMLFNPTYGRIGLLSFPYFLLFEVLGPWFEAEGYIVLIVSLLSGWISIPLFLLVFTATILLGILVSFISLILTEYRRYYFPVKDKLGLILYAFLENFGFRQFMNLLRIKGFFSMLARVSQWGQMDRRGFKV